MSCVVTVFPKGHPRRREEVASAHAVVLDLQDRVPQSAHSASAYRLKRSVRSSALASSHDICYRAQLVAVIVSSRSQGSTVAQLANSKLPFSFRFSCRSSRATGNRRCASVMLTMRFRHSKHRLESARAIKQGMMQELLTGRTRLPVEEAAA